MIQSFEIYFEHKKKEKRKRKTESHRISNGLWLSKINNKKPKGNLVIVIVIVNSPLEIFLSPYCQLSWNFAKKKRVEVQYKQLIWIRTENGITRKRIKAGKNAGEFNIGNSNNNNNKKYEKHSLILFLFCRWFFHLFFFTFMATFRYILYP